MAPSRIDITEAPSGEAEEHEAIDAQRPSMYLLEDFPQAAVEYCQNVFNTILANDPKVHSWREHADAVLVREKIISAHDIEHCQRLRAIGKQGTGIDIIDQIACARHNVAILNTPGVNAQAVAELVLTLTMAVARQIRKISVRQTAGKEVRKQHCEGISIKGKSIGIVGMGAIGTTVARMFQGAFGCHVYALDPYASDKAWGDIIHTRTRELEEMLDKVDILTLHVPLTPATKGMINMRHMKMMKSSAILINVTRGGIVDEGDLLEALNLGMLHGAGLDCHVVEPPTKEQYELLWETERVVSTPHIGAATVDTRLETAMAAIRNVEKFFRG
ncbi:hypothetical protein M409DRAFT_55615 [Zasmidium cellare ATCC 36951]|uniref:D-3-phosphoglycerate dehydrogenase n=1 Tax=Zasmidium cellare ATCC 36951 TaxID=1080233 RepID=A0A6A6CF33_ZASCE|nr:uncharacterized protein M409DRAFT_55615 [Zasmidium cellare ATCC 36951]KAF2165735.1 hypothetical protein M409DRAFT_55615 [Zasmidium cellare ATCC 36951]